MTRVRLGSRPVVFVLLPWAFLMFTQPLVTTSAADTSQVVVLTPEEQALAEVLYSARSRVGLQPLTLNSSAMTLAKDRSSDMATHDYFNHVTPDGKTVLDMIDSYGITCRDISETLAMNWNASNSGADAAETLINSPAHHAILFSPQFTAAGFGHAMRADGKHYFTVIVLSR